MAKTTSEPDLLLTPPQWQEYADLIREGRKALGIRCLGVIAPIRSLPVPEDKDTGIGSLLGAAPFFEFLTRLGFDVVQVDPEGKTKLSDPSPYTGTVFSTNPILIDLEPLTQADWGGVLSAGTFRRICENNPKKNQNEVAYAYIFEAQNEALREAYRTFEGRRKDLPELDARFTAFVETNRAWLEPDSIYEALSMAHGNDYWPAWPNEFDKNLYNPAWDGFNAKQARERVAELQVKYEETIGTYRFAQFVAYEQKRAFNEFAKRHGFSVMADRQVGLSDRDVWAYQPLFLKDWALGAPPDYFSINGQAWGFPVFDPEKLFNPDGYLPDDLLGEGGLLLSRLYDKIFAENPGGVRIDHIIGLIDPWVYPASAKSTRNGARLFSAPEHETLGNYAHVDQSAINYEAKPDDDDRVREEALNDGVVRLYDAVMHKIVLPSAARYGVPQASIICEDLGTLTNPVRAVMTTRGYSGIRVTQFVDPNVPTHMYRGRNIEPRHWVTTGTHDNEPILLWAKQKVERSGAELWKHVENLAEDLIADPNQREEYKQHLYHDAQGLARAKFAELFASPAEQVQVFFTDLFGIETPYNRPSTMGNENWVLRIPQDYGKAYAEALSAGRALNLPEVMAMALRARGGDAALIAELDRLAGALRQVVVIN